MNDINLCISASHLRYIERFNEKMSARADNEEHAHHGEFEIYYFEEGDLFFSFEGEKTKIKNGDFVIIASDTLHRTVISSVCRYYRKRLLISNAFFDSLPDCARELRERLCKKRIIRLDNSTARGSGLCSIYEEIERRIKLETPYDIFCAEVSLAEFLIRALETDTVSEAEEYSYGKAREIIKFIEDNLCSPLGYSLIAKHFHISEKSLYKLFKNETGFTLSKYITGRRIIKAKSLLDAGLSPVEVSEKTGFTDYSVFYRSFIRETGISPQKYSKEQARFCHASSKI